MKQRKNKTGIRNWLKQRFGQENEMGVLRIGKRKRKALTMSNTTKTKLTDFYPLMLKPKGQQDLVDWKALEPRPVREPDRHTGMANWPGADE